VTTSRLDFEAINTRKQRVSAQIVDPAPIVRFSGTNFPSIQT